MHRSGIQSIVIDCDAFDRGVAFWSQALGMVLPQTQEPTPQFVELVDPDFGVRVILQRVPEPKTCKSRMHVDIASSNVAAELTRLEALGAQRVRAVADWWIMQDPCGNEFCVVPAAGDDLPRWARTWHADG